MRTRSYDENGHYLAKSVLEGDFAEETPYVVGLELGKGDSSWDRNSSQAAVEKRIQDLYWRLRLEEPAMPGRQFRIQLFPDRLRRVLLAWLRSLGRISNVARAKSFETPSPLSLR